MMPAGQLTPTEMIIDSLRAAGCNPRGSGGGWSARCPNPDRHTHGDKNPSLSVTEADNGNALVCCHAGCTTADVCKALNLKLADLYPARPPKIAHIRDGFKIKATYPYHDADATLTFQVVRLEPKAFRHRQPDGHGGWIWNSKGVEKVLYNLPAVLAAVKSGRTIVICEGEKDAENAQWLGDYAATTCPSGAGNWHPIHTQALIGAAKVLIVADDDGPGIAHARDIVRAIGDVVDIVRVVLPAEGHKDLTDHVKAELGMDALRVVWDSRDEGGEWTSSNDEEPPSVVEERVPTTWAPVDLTDALSGVDIPPPNILTRVDGRCLLYPGRFHWFQGEPESLKTWAALAAVVEVVNRGENALIIDYEDDDRGMVARLLALGLTPEQITTHVVYLRPEEPLQDRQGHLTDGHVDFTEVLERSITLAILDGVTEAMSTEDLDLSSNADVAAFMRRLPKHIASVTGAAVVCIDHVVKSTEQRGRWAIGGQHKLAGVTGATYSFAVVTKLSRAVVEPVEASCLVKVEKDRPGHVRGGADTNDVVASMRVTSYPDGGVTVVLDLPTSGPVTDLEMCRRILEHLTLFDGLSKNRIEDEVQGNRDRIRAAVEWMAAPERGWVEVKRTKVGHYIWLTDDGRDEL